MNILERPELVDRLAASYALGTLRGGARRRFETLARNSPSLRVAASLWQERFVSLTEVQPSQVPGPNVWKRIENLVAADVAAAARPLPDTLAADLLRRARNWWRAGALAALAASLAVVAITLNLREELQGSQLQLAQLQTQGRELATRNAQLVAQLQAQPDVRYVSVLTDEQARPAMLVTFDPRRNLLMLKRVGGYQEGPDKSLQLWAIPNAGAPRSMGVLSQQPVLRMTAPEQMMGQSPVLAISLEPKGGVPGEGGPTGPVLWKGAVLQTPL
jgi:anti-sigma-K factor RskA